MTTLTLGHDTASEIFKGYKAWLKDLPNTESTARSYVANRMPCEPPKAVDCIAHCLFMLHDREEKH